MPEQAIAIRFLKMKFIAMYCGFGRRDDGAHDGAAVDAIAVAEVLYLLGEGDLLVWRAAVEELRLAESVSPRRLRADRERADRALDDFREAFEKLADHFQGDLDDDAA